MLHCDGRVRQQEAVAAVSVLRRGSRHQREEGEHLDRENTARDSMESARRTREL